MIRRQDVWPLGAFALLLAITAGWWALALWPLPAAAPAWLERARAVCFDTGPTGLPDASGWLLLTGQPLGMAGILIFGWGEGLRSAFAHLLATRGGRAIVTGVALALALGAGAAAVRVSGASGPGATLAEASVPETYPRVDRPAPDMSALVDQGGRPFGSDRFGTPALVTFAFGRCEAICPMVVQAARTTRDRVEAERAMAVVVVTLDPWRDTPARLPHLVEQWGLEPGKGDVVLGGEVEAVEAALDAWNVARVRDEATGEVIHPSLTYLVEAGGTIAYATSGAPNQLEVLAGRLR